MKFLPDWKKVLTRAYSVRFMAAAFVFSGLEITLPMLDGSLPIPPGVFAALSGLTTGAAFVARLVAQSNVPDNRS